MKISEVVERLADCIKGINYKSGVLFAEYDREKATAILHSGRERELKRQAERIEELLGTIKRLRAGYERESEDTYF